MVCVCESVYACVCVRARVCVFIKYENRIGNRVHRARLLSKVQVRDDRIRKW